MFLKLYNEPYRTEENSDLFRLLFESVDVPPNQKEFRDFYLSVWIGKDCRVAMFQAIVDDEYTVTCRLGESPFYSYISSCSIGRTLAKHLDGTR